MRCTHGLALRPVKPADAAALYPLMTWNVVRWLSGPPWPLSIVDVTTHLAKSEADMQAGTHDELRHRGRRRAVRRRRYPRPCAAP